MQKKYITELYVYIFDCFKDVFYYHSSFIYILYTFISFEYYSYHCDHCLDSLCGRSLISILQHIYLRFLSLLRSYRLYEHTLAVFRQLLSTCVVVVSDTVISSLRIFLSKVGTSLPILDILDIQQMEMEIQHPGFAPSHLDIMLPRSLRGESSGIQSSVFISLRC